MKVYLATIGCRANQYDTEAARAALEAGGAEVVSCPDEAQAAVFNSCAVTAAAEADLRRQLRRAGRANPALRTVVMGCAAALHPDVIAALPTVRAVVPGAAPVRVAAALGLPVPNAPPWAARQRGTRALLRIQDGCDAHCTFCATTRARGASRSRAPEELVREAEALAAHHHEIVLTGVHIGSYGADRDSSLGALVARLARAVPQVRFRLSSVEATEVDDRLRERLAARDGGLAPWLHAPLQSGSDRVLHRMGRSWYTAASYARAVERLAAAGLPFGLGADVMTGFPGETEADHRATIALVRGLPFTALHVFRYSPRPGTAATRLGDPVPPAVATRRARELRALGARKAVAYRRSRDDQPADVVVIGDAARADGLTEDHLPVIPTGDGLIRGTRYTARLQLGTDGVLFARPA